MFGAHHSVAGGLHLALVEASRLAMDCVQVFTKNQRQWSVPPLDPARVEEWFEQRASTEIRVVVSHASYLINPAAPDGPTRENSLRALRDEIERCEALRIPLLVLHPGSHVGDGEEAGLERVIERLDEVHAELPGYRTITCLENTAGQGSNLGHALEHLRRVLEGVREPERLAVCIDTAHALAAGYNLGSAAGARRFLREIDSTVGIDRVLAMHLNDSKSPRGSRVDRHEAIGHGHVSLDAFRVIVRHRTLRHVPKILETPKGTTPDGLEWDALNLATLRGLLAG
jgi:deoxyribonuclease-4